MQGQSSRFSGEILIGHKGAAVEVPFDPADAWKVSAQRIGPNRLGFPVVALVNGVEIESVVVSRSRRFWLLLDDQSLKAANRRVGDSIEVSLSMNGIEDLSTE